MASAPDPHPSGQRENLLLPGVTRWPRDPSKPVIQLVGVTKRFDGEPVLEDLSLDILPGMTTVICGVSGSGKSVLLKLMNGLLLPDEGDVFLFGENTRTASEEALLALRKRTSMLFQSYALLDSLDVIDNIAFPLRENTSMPMREILPRVEELLELLNLPDAGRKMPSELSGGMKKRVSLARAVITNPEVVLFDEPTTGLDPVMIEFVDKHIRRTQELFEITSVIVSHDMTSTLSLADRIAMLDQGRVVEFGTVDEVLDSGNDLVDVFFEGAGKRLVKGETHEEIPAPEEPPPKASDEPVVVIRDLNKSFGRHQVLKGVNLSCPRNRITVLIGGSGSGKSVIMKHIIGLMRPDSGEVRVFDQSIGELGERELLELRARIGMVFQGAALLDSMSVAANVRFPLVERGYSKRDVQERAAEVIASFGLTELADRFPGDISSGQRKRVGLARALVTRPEIVIYDEPITGQDPVRARYIDEMIVEAQDKFDITSIVISHDMPSTFRIGHQICMLHQGRIIAAGSAEELKASDDPHVRHFIFAGSEEGERAARELQQHGEDVGPVDA